LVRAIAPFEIKATSGKRDRPLEVAFGTFRQWRNGIRVIWPFRLAFAGVENRCDWVLFGGGREIFGTEQDNADPYPVALEALRIK
jgi:hypothetical protein